MQNLVAVDRIYRARIRRSRAATITLFGALREQLACGPMQLDTTHAAPSNLLRFLSLASPLVDVGSIMVMGRIDPLPVRADRHLADAVARHAGTSYLRLTYTDGVVGGPYRESLGERGVLLEERRSVSWCTEGTASIEYGTGMNVLDPAGGVRASEAFHKLREERLRTFVDRCLAALDAKARYDVIAGPPNEWPNERLGNVEGDAGSVTTSAGLSSGASIDITATPPMVPTLFERVVRLLEGDTFAPRVCTFITEGKPREIERSPMAFEGSPESVHVAETSVFPALLDTLDTLPAPFDLRLSSAFSFEHRRRSLLRRTVRVEGRLELCLSPSDAEIEVSIRHGLFDAQHAALEERSGVRFDHLMDV